MDEDVRAGLNPTRWLAWVTAGLLAAGLMSVGTVNAGIEATDQRIVTAAGAAADGVDLPTPTVASVAPVTEPPATLPPPPPSTAAPSTAPPTTQPARTTTTRPVVASTTVTTAPASSGRVTVIVANQHPETVVATVNGHVFQVASGQQSAPVDMALAANGNDIVEVHVASDPSCGLGDADRYFPAAGRYRLTVTTGPGMCGSSPGITHNVAPA